ncbi:zinc finger, CW-type [Artemisia annua]|nr:zinc finger, CW-type [Artemisia annua]
MNGKLKQEVVTSCGDKSKSTSNFSNDSDQKSLKVRIRVCSDDTLTRKNAEIYSGLGLDVSPSSSLEASPLNSDGFFHAPRDGPDVSPTSILEMMTSFPVAGSLLLSPLPYDILHLTEKKLEDGSCGPTHKGSQESTVTALHGSDSVKADQNVLGESSKSKSTEKNSASMESTNGDDVRNSIDIPPKKETSVDNFAPGYQTSSSDGQKKSEGGLKNESLTSKTKKKDQGSKSGKVKETYREFFGELDLENEDHDEMAVEKPSEGVNIRKTVENHSLPKERSNGKRSHKPPSPAGPHVPTMGNELGSDVAAAMAVPVVKEDWVCCDKCEKWRLLPPGMNIKSFPEKWLCSMLNWLPGMNRCSFSQEETTEAVNSRFPGPHPGGPQLGVIPPDGTHQHFGSQIPSSGVKKKHGNEAMQDKPSMSSNSSKKNPHTSYKTRSLNQSLLVDDMEFQDSGHSHDVIVEKDKLKKKENHKPRENFADEGDNIRHSKISKKRESGQDYPKDFKRVKTEDNDGTFYTGKSDKKEGMKKRKKMDELDGTGKNMKETSESSHRKEKKSRVLKSFDEGVPASKSKNTEDMKLKNIDTVMAATSSSSKVSGSHKTKAKNEEAKGSPVESVSSSPMRILKLDKYTSPLRNNSKGVDLLTKNVDNQPYEEKSKERRKIVNIDAISSQDLKKSSKKDVSIKEKSRSKSKSKSLPPRGQNEIERKENLGNNMSLKESKENKKDQGQNGNQSLNMKQPELDKHKAKSLDPTAVLVKGDLSNRETTKALKDATNLKHMADRLKNAGSILEGRALYIEAALKFLHVASLFEKTGISGDMIQSKSIYSSTAKLCEYCAHEYEKTKETTTAALAYKCMEVAYMKVIYYSHATALKDVNELQTTLPIGPTGESPSSSASASDLDNLNNPATVDKAAIAKGVNAPQVAGNLVIAVKDKPSYTRILNFAQEVNLAMEASRKSRIAFAASSSKGEVVVSAIKKALDFNFHDVEGLLQLVRVAMDIING